MQFLLLIIMFQTGQVSQIPFDSEDKCAAARNELKQEISRNAGYVTCIIK